MKRFLKILGFIVLTLVLTIGAIVIYIQWFAPPKYDTMEVPADRLGKGNIEIGKKIVSNLCVSCHLSDKGDLNGKVLMDHPDWGYITSGNLTSHPESQISNYTNNGLFYFLKTGIKNNGRMALPMMPKFATMSDQDLNAVITFIRSDDDLLNPGENNLPNSNPSFFLKALMKFEIKPVPFDPNPVNQVPVKNELLYGNYLVNGRYACYECHSRSTEKINYLDPPSTPGYLAGGSRLNVYGTDIGIRSANITPHPKFGIGSWKFEDFVKAIKKGERPDGKQLRPPMNRMMLDSIEVRAIWKYLQTVEPLSYEWNYDERMVTDTK